MRSYGRLVSLGVVIALLGALTACESAEKKDETAYRSPTLQNGQQQDPQVQLVKQEVVRLAIAQTSVDNVLPQSIEKYRKDMGTYPKQMQDLVTPPTNAKLKQRWHGPYAQQDALKDMWGQQYHYQYPGKTNRNCYDLCSAGPDGKFGNKDDITFHNQKK